MKTRIAKGVFLTTGAFVAVPTLAWCAKEAAPTIVGNAEAIASVQSHADYVWTLVAAALVFFMQAGFAMVETGFTRAKNAVNILMKNLMDFAMGSIAFWAIGFGLMFGATVTGWFGTSGFFLSDFVPGKDPWILAFWMFQVVFAATAATIVSGAMAERTKFVSYFVYGAAFTMATDGLKSWVSSILPAPRSSTLWAGGWPWRALSSWGRVLASSPKMAGSSPSRVTTFRWQLSACLSCGWAGSASIRVRQRPPAKTLP